MFRSRRVVEPLDARVEALLRGAPRVTAPDGLRSSILRAFEPGVAVQRSTTWEWLAVPMTAAAAYALVLIAGGLWSSPGKSSSEWVSIHPSAATEARVRVVDVDDPSLDALGSAGSLLAASPLEGP